MIADDLHAKLTRALELAADAPDEAGATANTKEILESLVQPLALALCALELRAIRQSFEDGVEPIEPLHSVPDEIDGLACNEDGCDWIIEHTDGTHTRMFAHTGETVELRARDA